MNTTDLNMDVKYLEIERERLICERDRERERETVLTFAPWLAQKLRRKLR